MASSSYTIHVAWLKQDKISKYNYAIIYLLDRKGLNILKPVFFDFLF